MHIETYKEDVRKANIRKVFFWVLVIILTFFLYFFFQWYYIDTKVLLNNSETGTTDNWNLIKPFWVIELNVLPQSNSIKINDKWFNNSLRWIFDYWNYHIDIEKINYFWVNLDITLNKKLEYYSNNIYLIKNPTLNEIPFSFDKVEKMDDNYILHTASGYLIYDSSFNRLNLLNVSFKYLGYTYFTNEWKIYTYDLDNNIVVPLLKKDWTIYTCENTKLFDRDLYCIDSNKMMSAYSISPGKDTLVKINKDINITTKYISSNYSGKYYNYEINKDYIRSADNLIHIKWLPYIIKDWILYSLYDLTDNNIVKQYLLPKIEKVEYAHDFGWETMIIGKKDWKYMANLIDSVYNYEIDLNFLNNLDNFKITQEKWVYIIKNNTEIYIYYKWGKLIKFIDWDDVKVLNSFVFLKKDWKQYYIDLFAKDVQ